MKKMFVEPIVEVMQYVVEDIMATSGGGGYLGPDTEED